ncbi:acyl-CoA dehydrogenase family protein [Glutamicibacter protophormiae]|uniref:Alkylation response protein AidB-like acyl-CoA dehydrogenase n=1 Tax=Glutamicibacter protophormiae TaxID=37930 RepID=A0ABS4XM11_GLUPR|nr:acyl-CoA dehydrogenase family protein [Glutamicibacter protophormiae]MBP2397541.1 alkylation response protein AidB-like acyl-CoA dehydrogenase [Glutamicibacter protophormiae]WPR64326.1 acyl-CoA dehydrogenase family protein [Glutamicibacter protophormiae]WPR67819.1 acyl-CoA dehydrogenase family protein [Glutamicibacter protophormiae]GGL78347.1 acyl-CoA dehydrogenase [Glutamicibacter protophormiae]
MHLRSSSEIQSLREELRSYFAALLTDEVRAGLKQEGEAGGPVHSAVQRQMGQDGWLGIGWPVEYGGQGRGPAAQFVFYDEAYRADAPIPMITMTTVGPTLMSHGSQEQKDYFLPKILAGELVVSIGYTEAEAGTDLASLTTRAVRDGDEYVINGSKVFTSGGDGADWIWLAARTDPDAPKHKGISLILVPTTDPGFSATPIHTVGGFSTTATYYDNIRVPVTNVVGKENEGWKLITTQLNHERVGLAAFSGICEGQLDDVREWLKDQVTADGTPLADEAWVRSLLATSTARLRAMRLMNWKLVETTAQGSLDPGSASAAKVFATETVIDVYRSLLEIVGGNATRISDAPWNFDTGRLALMNLGAQINTFGGGVAEIQREIVAWTTLGMARSAR